MGIRPGAASNPESRTEASNLRIPLPCMRCKTYSMEMDMDKEHQHIVCSNCEAVWCLQCKTIEVDPQWLQEVLAVQQQASKANLN